MARSKGASLRGMHVHTFLHSMHACKNERLYAIICCYYKFPQNQTWKGNYIPFSGDRKTKDLFAVVHAWNKAGNQEDIAQIRAPDKDCTTMHSSLQIALLILFSHNA